MAMYSLKINIKKIVPPKPPRKIERIKPSKYEKSRILEENKQFWKDVLTELDANNTSTMEDLIKQSSEISPNDFCEKLYSILELDEHSLLNKKCKDIRETQPRKIQKEPLLSFRKLIHVNRELESDTDVEISSSNGDNDVLNIHQEFLSKSERKQITWNTRYLQAEKEDEKTLIKKADDLTDRIAQEFCKYIKELGGDHQSQLFTPKTIKELFQIEFDTHAARGLQVVPKELSTINDNIAIVTGNIEVSRNAALAREISKDVKAEKRTHILKAFNRSLPRRDQRRAPCNDTKHQWRSGRHVPTDLVTLKTVWDGITNLRSVREYCRWMIQHPEHRRAPYLKKLGMFDPEVLNARLTLELQHGTTHPIPSHDNVPAPIDHLKKRLSLLAEGN